MLIDGKQIAEHIYDELRKLPTPKRFLAAIIVGDDPASASFVRQKEKAAKALGIDFRLYHLPTTHTQDELRYEVGRIAAQKSCGGVLVQLPLPASIVPQYVLNAIPPDKDVDVLSERSLGAFYAGRSRILPPAVEVAEAILKNRGIDMARACVAIVGLGFLIGRPIAHYFMRRVKEIYLLRRGSDFSLLARADLIILGAGSPGLINTSMLKEGAGIIDFGYGMKDGKVMGDFSAEGGSLPTGQAGASGGDVSKVGFYTPTPGGTGPILVASLLKNFYVLNP